jgi:hypothetical protein
MKQLRGFFLLAVSMLTLAQFAAAAMDQRK